MKTRTYFLGTYFNTDMVMRISFVAKIISWVILGVYGLGFLVQSLANILQVIHGFWNGMGVTDILQNILGIFEQPLPGIVYFIVLQSIAQGMLIFMDMEENTRRTAREPDLK